MRLQTAAIGVILVLLAIGAAFWLGVDHGRKLEQAAQLKTAQRIEKATKRIARIAWAVDRRLAEHQSAQRATFREIVREVPTVIDRPVYRNVCIDADGVRLLDRAVTAANASLGGPDGTATVDRAPADRN